MSYQVRQAIASCLGAVVALLAIWGIDASFLNEPTVQNLIIIGAGALASFIPKPPKPREPTLAEAYHAVDTANQARERARWAADARPSELHADDGYRRNDNP